MQVGFEARQVRDNLADLDSREHRWGLRQVRDNLAYLGSTGKGLRLVRDNLADLESTGGD